MKTVVGSVPIFKIGDVPSAIANCAQRQLQLQHAAERGKYEGIEIDLGVVGVEEWSTYMYNYKNQGLYRNHDIPLVSRINYYGLSGGVYEIFMTPKGNYSTSFASKRWHWIYKVPRKW